MSNSVRVFHDGNLVATYGTIQAAIDAPSTLAGSIIIASAGTYAEHVVLSKAVTLEGANDGIDGAEARGPETVITGGVKIAADGVTVDGVEISGSYDTSGTPDITSPPHIGLLIGGADATIENSVLTGDAVSSRSLRHLRLCHGPRFRPQPRAGLDPGRVSHGRQHGFDHPQHLRRQRRRRLQRADVRVRRLAQQLQRVDTVPMSAATRPRRPSRWVISSTTTLTARRLRSRSASI